MTRWLTDDEQRSWRAFLEMQSRLEARLHRQLSTDSGLSLADFAVLVNLTDVPDGQLRVAELGRSLQWEQSRTSHHVSRMEKRGLVRRRECAEDGRGAFVAITGTGRTAIENAAPAHVETVRRLFIDVLTGEQRRVLDQITARVLARLETEAG